MISKLITRRAIEAAGALRRCQRGLDCGERTKLLTQLRRASRLKRQVCGTTPFEGSISNPDQQYVLLCRENAKLLTTGRGTTSVMMSRIKSDTRYPLFRRSLCGQYSDNSSREPQFAVMWVPQPNTKATKKLMDQAIITMMRPAVTTPKIERLDTTKRRRQKKTMLSLIKPYAREDSSCNAYSIYCHNGQCIRYTKAASSDSHLLDDLRLPGILGQESLHTGI